jgi:dipeptide/tripeptide permease
MEWSRGWSAAAVLMLLGLAVVIYLNLATDSTSEAILLASMQEGQTRLIGMAIGVALSLAVGFLAFVMFETSLIGNFVVILLCAAWILKAYFLG